LSPAAVRQVQRRGLKAEKRDETDDTREGRRSEASAQSRVRSWSTTVDTETTDASRVVIEEEKYFYDAADGR
jgi:hypothetical protein